MIGDFVTEADAPAGQFVKGFATIDDVSLINVEVCACKERGLSPNFRAARHH